MSDNGGGILWAFRVASRPEVGGGHVTRCITLARALNELGDRVLFVLDENGLVWKGQIVEQGHQCISATDGPADPTPGCLIDGYDFDDRTIRLWRKRASLMVAIVDHQPQPEWADLTIAAAQPKSSNSKNFAGLAYALVDRRFVPTAARPVSNSVRNVLVSFGHIDSRNATVLALDALALLPGVAKGKISIRVAIGIAALHLQAVKSRVAQIAGAICEVNADMVKCYAEADFVIGGGGVGLLERMAQGIPSASVVLADNQRGQIELCAAAGGTLNAGGLEDLDAVHFADAMLPLIDSYELRDIMSTNARHAIDGQGAKRCAQIMWEAVRVH